MLLSSLQFSSPSYVDEGIPLNIFEMSPSEIRYHTTRYKLLCASNSSECSDSVRFKENYHLICLISLAIKCQSLDNIGGIAKYTYCNLFWYLVVFISVPMPIAHCEEEIVTGQG